MDSKSKSKKTTSYINKTKIISHDKENSKINIIIDLEILLPTYLFDSNFRTNLVDYLRTNYESHAWYDFYLEKIDFNPIMHQELPLIYLSDQIYKFTLPLNAELIYYNKNDIINARLVLKNNKIDNDISAYAVNERICCKIILNNDQIIEKDYDQIKVSIYDQISKKKYYNDSNIEIKLTKFPTNFTETGWAKRLNCEGEIYI